MKINLCLFCQRLCPKKNLAIDSLAAIRYNEACERLDTDGDLRMINIALVEDENEWAQTFEEYVLRFAAENKLAMKLKRFSEVDGFLKEYSMGFDVVFMDIGLPGVDGMEAAKRLRLIDKTVALVFVTGMAQFALNGYEVDALDFIVKPVPYFAFSVKMRRVVDRISARKETMLWVKTESGTVGINSSELKYVEIIRHYSIYHTINGDYKVRGTLKNVESLLADFDFVRCNNCYLVNLKYVRGICGYTVDVCGEELLISHPKRREFVRALNDYLGGGNV